MRATAQHRTPRTLCEVPMSEPVLERSVLERKERDELLTIARALGAKPPARAKKADIVDLILTTAGIMPLADAAPDTAPAPAGKVDDASTNEPVAPATRPLSDPVDEAEDDDADEDDAAEADEAQGVEDHRNGGQPAPRDRGERIDRGGNDRDRGNDRGGN